MGYALSYDANQEAWVKKSWRQHAVFEKKILWTCRFYKKIKMIIYSSACKNNFFVSTLPSI